MWLSHETSNGTQSASVMTRTSPVAASMAASKASFCWPLFEARRPRATARQVQPRSPTRVGCRLCCRGSRPPPSPPCPSPLRGPGQAGGVPPGEPFCALRCGSTRPPSTTLAVRLDLQVLVRLHRPMSTPKLLGCRRREGTATWLIGRPKCASLGRCLQRRATPPRTCLPPMQMCPTWRVRQ